MKRWIVLLACALLPALATAQDAMEPTTLSWEPPTTRVDGTPMDPATELAEYRLKCGGEEQKVTVIPATGEAGEAYELTKHEALPNYGEVPCFLTAVDTDGLESAPSDTVMIPWDKARPSAPTTLIILTGDPQ